MIRRYLAICLDPDIFYRRWRARRKMAWAVDYARVLNHPKIPERDRRMLRMILNDHRRIRD